MKFLFRRFYYLFTTITLLTWGEKTSAQQQILQFSHIAKITFPTKPHYASTPTDTAYTIKYNADIYALAIHSFRHDTAFTLDSGHLVELYNGFLQQLSNKPNITIISKKDVVINGLVGIEIKYKFKTSDTSFISYHRVLYVNRTLYNYGFSTLNDLDKASMDKKDAFLNSFLITEKKENLYQFYEVDDTNVEAYNLGLFIGKYLTIPLVIVIGLLIVFLIRRVAYKKLK